MVLSTSLMKGYRVICKDSNENLQSHIFRLYLCEQVWYSACIIKCG